MLLMLNSIFSSKNEPEESVVGAFGFGFSFP
jgi:hypothetical protein